MTPAVITARYRLPGTKGVWQRPPGTACAHNPQDAFHHQPIILCAATHPGSRQERRDLDPMGRCQFWQARYPQWRHWQAGAWSLPGPANAMMALGVRLMAPPKTRPPQPLRALFLPLSQGGQQATQFGDTQPDPIRGTAPFSWSCWVWARRTTRRAWASKAKVTWRYQPRQVRTS
jgi:hypothetical protein